MKTAALTAFAAALAFAGPAVSQTADETPPTTQASSDSSGFNLKMPGEADENDGYGGFNLALPGDDTSGVMLPTDARSTNAFEDLPSFESEAPAAPPEDDIIRLED
ncbi:MAG: hypothetical protein AAFS03_08935 [Pseudomonadota bacterium]